MKPWLRTLLIVIFLAVFAVCAWLLVDYFMESNEQQSQYDELANLVENARPTAPATPNISPNPDSTEDPTEPPSPWVEVTDPETGEIVLILPEYAEIYEMNNDIVGWLSIPGTNINYPVMQTPNQKDYYLYRNFYKQSSGHGCLYAREECDINTPSDNITIYGHHMKDGTMFARLSRYRSNGESFYEEHRYIIFDTLTEHHTYEIFAIFDTTATIGEGFDYHNFISGDEAEFNAFVQECLRLSYYDTGVVPVYGDKLITLSTCEYTQTNGRLVVVAKRIN